MSASGSKNTTNLSGVLFATITGALYGPIWSPIWTYMACGQILSPVRSYLEPSVDKSGALYEPFFFIPFVLVNFFIFYFLFSNLSLFLLETNSQSN